jgi:hypothetical protein
LYDHYIPGNRKILLISLEILGFQASDASSLTPGPDTSSLSALFETGGRLRPAEFLTLMCYQDNPSKGKARKITRLKRILPTL